MQVSTTIPFVDGAEEKLAAYVRDSIDTNSTMDALKEHYGEKSEHSAPLKVIPFSSSVKYGAICYPDETLILGAPEFVLSTELNDFAKKTEEYAKKGERVLVLARETGTFSNDKNSPARKAVAAVILNNALRVNAVETFQYFHDEGVTIKVISGDNPIVEITNNEITDGSACIVVKESFGNCFVPFLVDHYNKIYVIDYRYWEGSISNLVTETGATDVLCVNNLSMVRNKYLVGQFKGVVQ